LVITERTPASRCAYCTADFQLSLSTSCGGCRTQYHDACLLELDGDCGTIGCTRTKPRSKTRRERRRARRESSRLGATVDNGGGWRAWVPAVLGFSFLIGDGPWWVMVPIAAVVFGAITFSYVKNVNHRL
jgi:hypothetical protein